MLERRSVCQSLCQCLTVCQSRRWTPNGQWQSWRSRAWRALDVTFWGPDRDQDQLLTRVNYNGPVEKGDEAMEALRTKVDSLEWEVHRLGVENRQAGGLGRALETGAHDILTAGHSPGILPVLQFRRSQQVRSVGGCPEETLHVHSADHHTSPTLPQPSAAGQRDSRPVCLGTAETLQPGVRRCYH